LLRIRLSRTGKTRQESFRIVVAPHTNAVKGKYLELLGHYVPAENPKKFDIVKERVEYWISKGAKPSESMAMLLKKHGFANMDQYIPVRQKTSRLKKKEAGKAAPADKAAPAKAAPAKEAAPAA
jgi:small subunit ribosomal protein S16